MFAFVEHRRSLAMKQTHVALAVAVLFAMLSSGRTHAQAVDGNKVLEDVLRQNLGLVQEYLLAPDLQQRVRAGYKISPVPLDLTGKNVILVGLGSYIVNALVGCGDCHTNPTFLPSGNPFKELPKQVNAAGYLAGGQTFGKVVSRNLTPENGLPAGRTYAQFQQIMRTGIDLDKAHPQIGPLLQVMPWPTYQNMSDRDLLAIYTYLSAIPAITPKN